jgi:thiol-disulfide isomerase/thioredoxin
MKTAYGVVAAMVLAAAANALPAPKLSIASLADLPVAERTPYDGNADAKTVDAAFARARKNGKRVLIELGGNWCPDCLVLANLMRLAEMKNFLAAHFEVVAVDVGRLDRNLDIPARFGLSDRLSGVPTVIVVEANGSVVNTGKTTALTDARHMTPQAIADLLAGWAK